MYNAQVFQAKGDATLCGLVALTPMGDGNFLTFEQKKDRITFDLVLRVVILRREASGFVATQSIKLEETTSSFYSRPSFAVHPSGNVFCTLQTFESVHELRLLSTGKFEANLKAYRMPNLVRHISGFTSDSEWLLVASLIDGSVLLFRVNSEGLELNCKVSLPPFLWSSSMVSVSDKILIGRVYSKLQSNTINHSETTGVELLSLSNDRLSDQNASFSSRRLIESSGSIRLLHASRQPSGLVVLVAFDHMTSLLMIYELCEQ